MYGVAALAHELVASGADISHSGQHSRLDVGDMSLLEFERRLEWKTYRLVYDVLEEVFSNEPLPDLVLLDVPLVMGRAMYAQALEDSETDAQLKSEIGALKNKLEAFWSRHIERCYPFDSKGPRIVTLVRARFGSLLRLIEKRGQEVSPDPIDGEVERLIKTEWVQVLSVGIDRVLRGILLPEHRTAAFDRDQDLLDQRAFPQTLIQKGSVGFHYLTGLRGQPVQVGTIGSAAAWHDRGGPEALDRLAADLIGLTYFDHRKSLPLPLWYAREGVEVVKKRGLLEFYKRETLRAMREEQVDQAWLAGWEED
jgi:hypothetical protein